MATYQSPPIEPDPVPSYKSDDITIAEDSVFYSPDIIPAFFTAIESNDSDFINTLLDENPGLVEIPDVSRSGMLPLYFATIVGNTFIVALLAQRGAPIDQLSPTGAFIDKYDSRRRKPIMRTPLMAAAAQGSLPLVKLLFNDLKADDGVVAPDGMIALHLAHNAEILALLPTRRRGGWRRFKHSQRKGLRRIKKAGYMLYRTGRFFVWDIPKFFLWDIPKLCLPSIRRGIMRGIKAVPYLPIIIYLYLQRFAKWIWSCVLGIPQLTVDVARGVWDIIKGIPGFLKGCYKVARDFCKWLFRLVFITFPRLLLSMGKFVIRMLKNTGAFILQFLKDVASFIHTVISAIITRLKNVTLKDIANAFRIVLVAFPKFVWNALVSIAVALKNGVVWTVKQMGDLVHFFAWLLWQIIIWVPENLGQILLGTGEIMMAATREIVVLVNPKARRAGSV